MKIRVVVADDHKLMRDTLRDLLGGTEDIEVVAMAEDGHQAVELTRAMKPDLVVMDLEMPCLNGIEATRQIVSEFPGVKVVALSIHADRPLVMRMLAAGASEYLLKDVAFEQLARAIRAAAETHT